LQDEELKDAISKEFDKKRAVVAFLDILGFKDIVRKYVNPKNHEDKKTLEDIKFALNDALKQIREGPYSKYNLVKYKIFSDSTSFSVPEGRGQPYETSMLCMLMTVVKGYNFQLMLRDKYPRGGIATGFHHEDENMIFSESLIKAYTLESEKAIYPRTVLDEELVKRLKKMWKYQKNTMKLFGTHKQIITDKKGTTFVNPFNVIYSSSRDQLASIKKSFTNEKDFVKEVRRLDNWYNFEVLKNVENKLEEYKDDEDVLPKYEWLKELLQWNIDPESSNKFEYLL
jgi:hypothetical protein